MGFGTVIALKSDELSTPDPARDGVNWIVYCAANPVDRWDPTGLEDEEVQSENSIGKIIKNVVFIIFRTQESREAFADRSKRGTDTIIFTNTDTGQRLVLSKSQTSVSIFGEDGEPVYSEKDTLKAYQGQIGLQYLGNNTEIDQLLFRENTSKYYGPVFNVINTETENGEVTNNDGLVPSSAIPYRMHSNYNILENKEKPLASGGCPMYNWQQADAFSLFLDNAGIKPGDIIMGYIKEDYPL